MLVAVRNEHFQLHIWQNLEVPLLFNCDSPFLHQLRGTTSRSYFEKALDTGVAFYIMSTFSPPAIVA